MSIGDFMATFRCKIGTADGRILEKDLDASSRGILKESLEEQGFHVFRIQRRGLSLSARLDGQQGRMSGSRFLSFNQELLVLLRAGLPIMQVLDTIMERMESGRTLEILREIREDVKGGSSVSEAFGRFPNYFPSLYIASIRAGERTGELPLAIERFIAYQKRVEAIKSKVRNASFYPILLSMAVIAVVFFLMLFVIPRFTQIYTDAQVQLPMMTHLLITVSRGLGKAAPLLIPLLVVLVFAARSSLRTEKGQWLRDRVKLILPFFGHLFRDYALLSFCRTLGTTLASGIPVVPAMQMSRGTLNNRLLEERLSLAVRRVQEGASLSEALEETGFFPRLALRMIGVGETGGSLSTMLEDVAMYYESEVEKRLDRLTTLIEPAMMMTMGLLIGAIVVAMYLPIFQLAGTAG